MADLIKVKVRAQAYEKHTPKTALSEFDNDLEFTTKEELIAEINALREWILQNVTGGGGGEAIAGGSVNAHDVAEYSKLLIRNRISGNDVAIRAATPVRLFFYGGDIKGAQEATA
ncbi:MAG: hypothetical protein NC218_01385 [Acetobacter sp.]|nr:hypothetical protein [Acetobacter sp.]